MLGPHQTLIDSFWVRHESTLRYSISDKDLGTENYSLCLLCVEYHSVTVPFKRNKHGSQCLMIISSAWRYKCQADIVNEHEDYNFSALVPHCLRNTKIILFPIWPWTACVFLVSVATVTKQHSELQWALPARWWGCSIMIRVCYVLKEACMKYLGIILLFKSPTDRCENQDRTERYKHPKICTKSIFSLKQIGVGSRLKAKCQSLCGCYTLLSE